jgi:hypothetical protein
MEKDPLSIYYLTKIVGGYAAFKDKSENEKLLIAYFKRVAREAEKENSIDFALSFRYLKDEIEKGEMQIFSNFQQVLERKGLNIGDLTREEITKHISEIGRENRYVDRYTTLDTIYAGVDAINLSYEELKLIERSITQAEQELTPHCDKTEKEQTAKQTVMRQFTDDKKELLKTYFISTFKGMGNGNVNYFDEYLITDLQKNRTSKEYAQIALLIYQSDKSVRPFKEKPFAGWYNTFCNLMDIKKCDYKPATLTKDVKFEHLKREFYYL